MAVQAQFYSDYYYQNMGLSQDWAFGTIGDENKLPILSSSSFQQQQDSRFLDSEKIMNSDYHNLNLVSSRRNGLQNLSSELERQRLEMDCFLHFQNEKLKAALSEETRKRELILMYNFETKLKSLIEAKEQVLTTAKTRTNELENYLKLAENESKTWEKKASENEAIVTELTKRINQVKSRKHDQEDAESVCCFNDEEKERKKKMVCKMCHVRSSCVLLLPCRHVCCCLGCEEVLMFCPVCENVKNGSLEVFFGEG